MQYHEFKPEFDRLCEFFHQPHKSKSEEVRVTYFTSFEKLEFAHFTKLCTEAKYRCERPWPTIPYLKAVYEQYVRPVMVQALDTEAVDCEKCMGGGRIGVYAEVIGSMQQTVSFAFRCDCAAGEKFAGGFNLLEHILGDIMQKQWYKADCSVLRDVQGRPAKLYVERTRDGRYNFFDQPHAKKNILTQSR